MSKRYKKIIDFFEFLCLVIFGIILATNRSLCLTTLDGAKMFTLCILPSLFPFLIITSLLAKTSSFNRLSKVLSPISSKIFNVNGKVCSCYFLSLLSGYPMGAKCVCDLYLNNEIDISQAKKGIVLCSTPSPSFLINTVGIILYNNQKFGLLLFLSCFISSIIIGIIFPRLIKNKENTITQPLSMPNNSDFSSLFFETISSATLKVISVGGVIVAFYIITEVLSYLSVLSPLTNIISLATNDKNTAQSIAVSIFESSKGISLLSKCDMTNTTLPIVASICGFGGISVILQSLIFIKKTKIKIAPFILSKIVSAIIYFIVGFVISFFFL